MPSGCFGGTVGGTFGVPLGPVWYLGHTLDVLLGYLYDKFGFTFGIVVEHICDTFGVLVVDHWGTFG